jgi:hypothetical protein
MARKTSRDKRRPGMTFDPAAVPAGPVRFAPTVRTAQELVDDARRAPAAA